MDTLTLADEVTEQTLAEVRKAQSTGYNQALGLTAYELEAPAKSLFPVLAPFRNMLPRKKAPVGSVACHWKAITKINAANANPATKFGRAGRRVDTVEQDVLAAYKVIALDDRVEMDSQALARGFDDLRARSGTNLLYALMIGEDKLDLGAQSFALPVAPTPSLSTSNTGGSITESAAVHVSVSSRTLENFMFGGGSQRSADATVTTSATVTGTHSVSASCASVPGAVAYDWFVGASSGTKFYVATTTVNALTITTIPVADAVLSTLPLLGGVVPTYASRAGDVSADSDIYNGLLATITGDYTTAGAQVANGTGDLPSGAYIKSLDGATLTGANGGVTELDDALQSLWDTSRVSPTKILLNSQHHRDVTRKVISTFGASTLFSPTNEMERQSAVGGVYMRSYLNPAANGQAVELITMPHLPDGTIIGITETLPYPSTNVDSVYEVETQQEYQQLEYPASRGDDSQDWSGPRYDLEVRAIQTFKNQFPAGSFVLQNVKKG